MKTALKILGVLGIILAIVALLAGGAAVAVQSPKVQEKIGKRVLERLDDKFDADITFSDVSIRFPEAIVLKDVVIVDKAPQVEGADTVATIGLLSAKFNGKGIIKGEGAYVSHATLKDASFVLAYEKDSLSKTGTRPNYMRIFHLEEKEEENNGWGDIVSAGHLDIDNFKFTMLNPYSIVEHQDYPGVIDWNNLHVNIDRLLVRHLKVKDSYVQGTVDTLRFRETLSGFDVNHMSGKVKVGKERVRIDNFQLRENQTSLSMDRFQLDGPIKDYGQFTDKIKITADIDKGSVVDMGTISHFGRGIDKMTFRADIDGKVKGYVNDFNLDNFHFKEHGSNVEGRLSGNVMDIPNIQQSLLGVNIKNLSFTLDGLSRFVKSVSPATNLNLKKIARGKRFTFSGTVKGPFNRMAVNGKVSSGIGLIKTGVTIRNTVDPSRPIIIGGNVKTQDLDLGAILDTESLGPLTLDTGLEATLAQNDTKVRIDSLRISRLNALNYDYTNISAAGTYSENAFDGRIASRDPNLDFLFQGTFNLSNRTKNAVYRFYANLAYADLHALHLDGREKSKMWFTAYSNFMRTEDKEILGDVRVTDLSLESDTGYHDIGSISISSHSNEDMNRIQLLSGFLEGSFVGEKSVVAFVNDIRNLTIDRELPALTKNHAKPWDKTSYEIGVKVHKAQEILNFFAPGVYIADGSSLNLKVDRSGHVKGNLSSGILAYGNKYLKDVNLTLDNASSALLAKLESSAFYYSGTEVRNNLLTLYAEDNQLGVGYTFDNESDKETRAELYLTGAIDRDRNGLEIKAKALPSNLYYNGSGWGVNSGDIVFKEGSLKVDRLVARHDAEEVMVTGGFSPSKTDTLRVNLDNFGLSILDNFTGAKPALAGKANGQALILSPISPAPGLLASIVCDSTMVDGHKVGTLNLDSHWTEATGTFDFSASNRLEAISNLSVNGWYKPSAREINATAKLLRLDLGYASFVLDSVFSQIEGAISGEIGVNGKVNDLSLTSRGLHLDDGLLELDFTRVPYNISGNLSLDEFGLHFDDLAMDDGQGGRGTVGGSVLWGGFKNMGMDTHVAFDDLHAISLARGVNSTLSGDVYASGRAEIVGPMHSLNLDVDATTTRVGNVRIPISGSGGGRSTQILTFTEPPSDEEQDFLAELTSGGKDNSDKRSSNLSVHLKMTATPDVNLFVDIGDDNSLSGSGSGTVELELPAQGEMALNGDYTFIQGNFHFSAMGLVSRDFSIQDGSSVRFNGDVWDTDLDVNGTYSTKTSLASLISDENATNRRTVLCNINLSDKLRNPLMNFDIEIPDLNPSTKAMVESALNTEDKVQKQFLALLVTGNFLPDDESGITTGGTNTLFSNVTGIMASQINTIFQKLDIPLDLGLNYQSSETGNDVFDVALSTQLFNNRVIVNGNIGNKQQYGMSTNEVAGDVDVEIKVNKSGSLRLNLFSHSADQFTSYLDNSQRNGAGVTYQREFNTFKEFVQEVFTPRSKRQEAIEAIDNPIVLQVDTTGRTKIIR